MSSISQKVPSDLIVYHYNASPYARRVIWYLALRGIPYAECMQPPVLPRPDLKEQLNVNYRRIPVLAHRGDIFLDSRHILSSLEALFPATAASPTLAPATSTATALLHLLNRYTTDAGLFARGAALIPGSFPALKDPKFQADRSELTGRSWDPAAREKAHLEGVIGIQDLFKLLEGLLSDGRTWLSGEEKGPGLVDIEGIWLVDWLFSMKKALPEELFNAQIYPRTFSWHLRSQEALSAAKKKLPSPVKLSGAQAAEHILSFSATDSVSSFKVDPKDPLGLRAGESVTLYPTDTGTGAAHRDTGILLGLTADEVVVEKRVIHAGGQEGKVRLRAPRWGFRVVRAGAGAKL